MTSPKSTSLAQTLLQRAHSPTTAREIHTDSILRRPLLLRPTSSADQPTDKRSARQRARAAKAAQQQRKRRKPAPLSAKQKRQLGVHQVPAEQQKWAVFEPLHRMWLGYVREVLGVAGGQKNKVFVEAKMAGALLAAADLHGALVEVVRCRCVGRVGIRGIVAKETRGTLEIITEENVLKVVPKEYTIFKLEIPLVDSEPEVTEDNAPIQPLVFELYGSQLVHRPAERATRKLKPHLPPDI